MHSFDSKDGAWLLTRDRVRKLAESLAVYRLHSRDHRPARALPLDFADGWNIVRNLVQVFLRDGIE